MSTFILTNGSNEFHLHPGSRKSLPIREELYSKAITQDDRERKVQCQENFSISFHGTHREVTVTETIQQLTAVDFDFHFDGDNIPAVTDIKLPEKHFVRVDDDDNELHFGDLMVIQAVDPQVYSPLYDEFNAARMTGDTSSIKKPISIYLKDDEAVTIHEVNCTGSWVKEYHPPTLGGETDQPVTEHFVISVDHAERAF